jgi:hypothetical protein
VSIRGDDGDVITPGQGRIRKDRPFLVTVFAPLSMSIVNRDRRRRDTSIVAAYLRELRRRAAAPSARPAARSPAPAQVLPSRDPVRRETGAPSISR